MKKARALTGFSVALALLLTSSLVLPVSIKPAVAHPGTLMWSVVDTPNPKDNIIVSPSEINVLAIGSDGTTFYAADIPGSRVYKSSNGGITWQDGLTYSLTAAGASLPVWNIAVAPDDVNLLVAVTRDPLAADSGPRRVFVSENGGTTWKDANISFAGSEYISCVDISIPYGTDRDIAIGTRTGSATGRVFAIKSTGVDGWADQNLPSSDVVALKFSPTYASDTSLVVVSTNGSGTFINLGTRDTAANNTSWNTVGSYPVEVRDTNRAETSPTASQIITADLELPSDFSGQTLGLRRYYVSTDANVAGVQSGIHRVDDTVAYWITPPTSGRISSIVYRGTYTEGELLAGEVTADPLAGKVCVWRASDLTASTPSWQKSDNYKSPTGGGNSSYANALVAWSSDGARAYCGTSSANLSLGGTGWGVAGKWPFGYTAAGGGSVGLDESAFSVSPYSPAYEQLLIRAGKAVDDVIGDVWNQLSLIDTLMGQAGPPFSFLSDVAVLEVPESTEETPGDYNILYLASINDAGGFDSLWRSTSDPQGRFWERILCTAAANDVILRVKQTSYDETTRSRVIVFADAGTNTVGYSADEGQRWKINPTPATVTDVALAGDTLMYILNDTIVYRYEWKGNNWMKTYDVNSELDSGHSIAVPLKNPEGENEETEDWVIVGESGPPLGLGRVTYADFSDVVVEFEPAFDKQVGPPVPGDAHVIADDRFEQNKIIYVGICEPVLGTTGKIYRWKIGESTDWDELEPPNSAFYGLAQRNDVLYGAWEEPQLLSGPRPGVDRTLYSRATVPPPPEWDDLTTGLPLSPNDVSFTREPSSLKISSNEYNNLWAIDNRDYDWAAKEGCLWAYTDTVAKVGPWSTTPPSGDFIPVDPVSGRAKEVNFAWRQLSYASLYELQLAKDRDFSIVALLNDSITPVDQLAPACFFPAGGLVPAPRSGIANWGNLESNHTYYWRVRARAATTGEIVRSPWSATMYFTVMAGLPVKTKPPTLTLLNPPYGAGNVSQSIGFSWSPMPETTQYEFILAKDAALTQVVVKTNVSTTSYMYNDELDWNTTYFWQVKATEPVVSEPSPIGSFTVAAEPEPEAEAPKEPAAIPFWIWAVISIYAALMAGIIALVMIKPGHVIRRIAAENKMSPMLERPQSPLGRVWNAIVMRARRWRYLRESRYIETDDSAGEITPADEVSPMLERIQNPLRRAWSAIVMRARRWRYLRKSRYIETDDSREEQDIVAR